MTKKWLSFYLKISGINYYLKNKIVSSSNLFSIAYYSLLTIIFQFFFIILSFPIYLLVSPEKVQEVGFIFPKKERETNHEVFIQYGVRRKIGLGTFFSASSLLIFKLLFIGVVSFFLLGGQPLLALTQDWDFTTAGNYTYDSAKIEVTGGVAQLKNLTVPASGGTTNTGFNTNTTGWTGVPGWITAPSKNNSTNYQSSGGNPGGYINVNLQGKKSNSSAGFWYQSFTTTATNPTATLNLNWKAFTVSGSPSSYHLYAYIATSTGNPVLGTEVWDSGNISATTAWASSAQVDISSKFTSAGTYYIKIAAYHTCTSGTDCTTLAGFDNVVVSWNGSGAATYDTSKPTIKPTTSLLPIHVTNWTGFTETATKNGGEIYYQVSDDDGATWKYWSGSAWASAGGTNYNTAAIVNTNISAFPKTNNKIMWKAFLESNGSQQVILDNVAIAYTENDLPHVTNIVPTQATSTPGIILVNYNITDNESDPASLVTYEYSTTGAFAGEQVTMTASSTYPGHDGTSGLTTSSTGIPHLFAWNALSNLGAVFNNTVYVRLRANDGIGNGTYATSTAITVDMVNPIVSNVAASQALGTTTISITYDLSDNTTSNIFTELEVSNDSGLIWTIPHTSVNGAIGSGVAAGTGKTISWNAGTDYDEHATSTMRVHVRARDAYYNQGTYATSSNFTIDTLNPVTNVVANLKAQPNAGDSTVLIGGSFTEANPNTNDFYLAITGGTYSTSTAGTVNTATPSDQNTAAGATLKGNDYISKVKIIHTDDYGQATTNENVSPSVSFKYVKPYTPQAPILSSPITTQLNLTIVPNVSEVAGLEYLIQETTTGKYVQTNGSLNTGQVWRADSAWGTATVTGLTSPVANYIFQVKSRNTSDAAHASSSESAFSATAKITNTAPTIVFGSIAQTSDGTKYTTINYTGTDGQGDINNLVTYEYSRDNSIWSTITEKAGVGSEGFSALTFLAGGSAHNLKWDSGTNLFGVEDSTVYVRLRSHDGLASSTLVTSSAFEIDNVVPVVSSVSAVQNAGSRTVAITYNLADANNSLVEISISEDGGVTWTVPSTSVSGAVGSGVLPGTAKAITWNAGTDFSGQYQNDLQVRVRARDTFGNQGAYVSSANFTLDTKAPVVSNVTAVQDSAADTFTFHYDVSEDAGNVTTVLEISNDGGSTWTVPKTSATGNVGTGIVPGTGKTITWDGSVDYNGHEAANMKIRITATDQFSNNSNNTSANFNLDTLAPRVTSVSAVEVAGTINVSVTYDLADQNNSLVEMDISGDGGSTWTVTNTSVTGDIGAGIGAGSKTIVWNAGTDYDEQQKANMRVRVRARDVYLHQGANVSSVNFSLDTLNPTVNVVANLQAQPNAGDTTALIGGSFTEINPKTNNFYVAINGGSYSTASVGSANTATPANQATAVGITLKGNDYISAVKIAHIDNFGQAINNENFSVTTVYKYVKPYMPAPATVSNPALGTVRVLINQNAAEVDGLDYAIYESTQNKYVQTDGTLGSSPVWKTRGTSAGQWGETSGIVGGITVNGLANHSYTYIFQTKSRNISDAAHAASSESALSTGASSTNQSPVIAINSVAQTTNGTKYVVINYTGSDLESETSSLSIFEYSQDNSTWHTMTEKSGVGSSGTSGLAFTFGGASFNFSWDAGTDLANTEDSTVYVRLRANDGTSNGNITTSSAFVVDTKNPVISSETAGQTLGTKNVAIAFNLTDLSNSNVEINISEDGGSTWTVSSASVTGDVGANVSPGTSKSIIWNAGADFSNQEQNDIQTRVRALDAFGNQGVYFSSANFTLDTKNPVVSNVSASQNSGANTVTVTYDLSDAHNSNVAFDVSGDGGTTWTVANTSATGNVGPGVTPGTGKTIIWNAGADYPGNDKLNMRVRVRATDTYSNASGNVESANFSLDTLAPSISNVTAIQTLGGNNVFFHYDLADNSGVTIAFDISEDSGTTWTVAKTSATGDIGAGVTQGTGKTITWNAGTDFAEQSKNTMRVRMRGSDIFTNTSANIQSADFLVDTLNPTTNIIANLQAQPNAGDTTALIGGSFTEANPNTNNFYVAVNGGAYSSATAGDTNTASPANLATAVGVTLKGNNYISKVKISHTDDYGHSFDNENLAPNVLYKYVKPYTPQAPTVANPQNTSVDVTINPNTSEVSGLEYAIFENYTGKYVQANGTLGTNAVWQATSTWATKTVTGLTSPAANYGFQVKSRNSSDAGHVATSESSLSSTGQISNTAPSITINSVSQQTGGVNYVLISYTGTDMENDTNHLIVYEYSLDNTNWSAMTEKTGVGSNGTAGLIFASVGTSYNFAWNSGADLPNVEDSTVYIRLKSSDTLANGNLAVSSAFPIDNRGPVVSNVIVSQTPGTNNIIFNYDLVDNTSANISVALDISEDSGATWTVNKTSVSGDVSSGRSAGTGKAITWGAGIDFSNQEKTTMRVRIRALDSFGNQGANASSSDFALDTKAPVVTNVSATQTAGTQNFVIHYDLSDNSAAGHAVQLEISNDGGSTWTSTSTSVSGDIGAGQTNGTAKIIAWNAGTDYPGHEQTNMKLRVRAQDYFGNQGAYASSANFSIDTKSPVISGLSVIQNTGNSNINITYNLADVATANSVELEISGDSGATWTVTHTASTGDLGAGVAPGSKTITWNAGTDFASQEQTNLRVRLRATDNFSNQGSYIESSDFAADTRAPISLANLNKFSATSTSVTLNWDAGVADASFKHFVIWHGANLSDVNARTGTAHEWNETNDSNLSNINTISTVLTGLSLSGDYFAKIWAVDNYGNETTIAAINVNPAIIVPQPSTGSVSGSSFIASSTSAPGKAILSPVTSPTNIQKIEISGLADPRSRIELFDNGNLFVTLGSTADNNGVFSQSIIFPEGKHILKAQALNFSGNAGQFSNEVNMVVDLTAPSAPIVLSHTNGQDISVLTPELIGISEAFAQIEIRLDKKNKFTTTADETGAWRFALPSQYGLALGVHTFILNSIDQAGNRSSDAELILNKITTVIPPAIISPVVLNPVTGLALPLPGAQTNITPITPIPSGAKISTITEATELPGVPVPRVTQVASQVSNNTFRFSGTALPNKDVVIYIHSNEALVYQTKADAQGIWSIDHSQDAAELSAGEHSIYAVMVDTNANVKSRPSLVNKFTVKKSIWVTLYNLLNLPTTIFVLVIVVITMLWLYRIKKRTAAIV